MLTFTNNLDRTDEAVISNWPFTYESTLDTGNGSLSANSFLAISVNVDESVSLPCRFKGVSNDGRLVICDSTGAEICSGQLYEQTHKDVNGVPDEWCSFFLYNQYGVLNGFITCKSNVAQQLFALGQYTESLHYFAATAFVLLPQCYVQSMQGHARSWGVNGKYGVGSLTVRCSTGVTKVGHNVLPSTTSQQEHSFSVFNIASPEKNKWCRIIVNGDSYNVAGKNLIVKSSLTSNLRVIYSNAAIILRGVLDAQ